MTNRILSAGEIILSDPDEAADPASPSTILLIDDHPMLRNGVRQLISMEPSLTVAGEAGNGRDGIALAESLDPDLILLDLNMPEMNGFETLDILRRKPLSGRVVVFSVSNYREDLITALRQAAAGKMVVSPALTEVLAGALREVRSDDEPDINSLTPRERDILKLIAQGQPNKMIARKLDITESTVKVHVKNLMKKMKVKSRVEAAVWVLQNK